MQSEKSLPFESLLSLPTSKTCRSPLPPGPWSPGALAGRGDVELLVVGREAEAVRVRHLALGDHHVEAPARVEAVDVGRQLATSVRDAGPLAECRLEMPRRVRRAAGDVGRAFVELAAGGRGGEPVAAVGVRAPGGRGGWGPAPQG